MPRQTNKEQMMHWPHAPVHWFYNSGIYMVTSGTYLKLPYLNADECRDYFLEVLFAAAAEFGWQLRAWAVMPNHYHFVACSQDNPATLRRLLSKLHMRTSKQFNLWERKPGRKVWYQFWGSHISYERSYLARLNYVHNNPVKHGLAQIAENYPWCSAAWFTQNASLAFVRTVQSFKTDQLRIIDDF